LLRDTPPHTTADCAANSSAAHIVFFTSGSNAAAW
jgi:hypothetical protein